MDSIWNLQDWWRVGTVSKEKKKKRKKGETSASAYINWFTWIGELTKELWLPSLGSSRIYLTHILAASRVSTSGGLGFHSHVARLKPFLRLAASLVRHNCHITLITPHPTVLLAESQYLSDFLSALPQVQKSSFISSLLIHLQQTLLTLFFPAVGIHSPLCSPSLSILSSVSPPLNAVITDVTLISSVLPVTINLHLPNYIFFIHMQEWVTCWVFPFYCCIQNQLWFHSIWRWPWNSRLSFNAHTMITSSASRFK